MELHLDPSQSQSCGQGVERSIRNLAEAVGNFGIIRIQGPSESLILLPLLTITPFTKNLLSNHVVSFQTTHTFSSPFQSLFASSALRKGIEKRQGEENIKRKKKQERSWTEFFEEILVRVSWISLNLCHHTSLDKQIYRN